MIIKIKKRKLIFFGISASALAFLLLLPYLIVPLVFAGSSNTTFIVQLAVTNVNPDVFFFNETIGFLVDPTDGSKTEIIIAFNASDADGVDTINGTGASGGVLVNLTLGSPGGNRQFRTHNSCSNITRGSGATGWVEFTCKVNMSYYDNASSAWVINISVTDASGGVGRNDTNGSDATGTAHTFRYNALSALQLPYIFINFSSVSPGDQNVRANRLVLNNTGNDDFSQLNLSGGSLVGDSDGATIAITNFGVNLTNSSANLRESFPSNGKLQLKDSDTGLNASLRHGHTSALTDYGDTIISDKGNLSAFFWVNVPTGVTTQLYNASWNITVIP